MLTSLGCKRHNDDRTNGLTLTPAVKRRGEEKRGAGKGIEGEGKRKREWERGETKEKGRRKIEEGEGGREKKKEKGAQAMCK